MKQGKKFRNFKANYSKQKAIIDVLKRRGSLKSCQIAKDLRDQDYTIKNREVAMFLYYHMQYQTVKATMIKTVKYWSLI